MDRSELELMRDPANVGADKCGAGQGSRRADGLEFMAVQSDLMAPTLNPGQRIAVDTNHRHPSPDGVYMLEHSGDLLGPYRLMRDPQNPERNHLAVPDNGAYQTQSISFDGNGGVSVYGRVVMTLQPF